MKSNTVLNFYIKLHSYNSALQIWVFYFPSNHFQKMSLKTFLRKINYIAAFQIMFFHMYPISEQLKDVIFFLREISCNFALQLLLLSFFRQIIFKTRTQWGYCGKLSHFFDKNFVKVTFLLKKILV